MQLQWRRHADRHAKRSQIPRSVFAYPREGKQPLIGAAHVRERDCAVLSTRWDYFFAQAMHQPFGVIVPVTILHAFGALKKRHPEHFWFLRGVS